MTLEHYQTAFQPLLYGVGLAIVLTLLPEGDRTGGAHAGRAHARRHAMNPAKPEPESTNSCWSDAGASTPVPTAVAHPCEESALAGAIEAGEKGLITPILVGPAAKIREIAQQHGIDLGDIADRRRAAQPRVGGEGGRAGSRRARPSC